MLPQSACTGGGIVTLIAFICSPIETCHLVHHCNVLSQVPLVKKFCSAEVRFVNANFENRNANFANPKLMLHAMPASKSENERRFAVNVIKKIKKGADLGAFLPCQFRLQLEWYSLWAALWSFQLVST